MIVPTVGIHDYLVVDLETTSLNWYDGEISIMAITTPDGRDYALDFRDQYVQQWAKAELPKAKMLVNHNLKFDLHFLKKYGINFEGPVADTMVYAALINEHRLFYDLDSVGMDYLRVGKDTTIYAKLADIFGGKPTKEAQAKNLGRGPWELVAPYAMQDTHTTMLLYEWQKQEIEKQELSRVAKVEMDLLPVLVDMEHHGVAVDLDATERAIPRLTEEIDKTQKHLDDMAGFSVNPNSPKAMRTLFKPEQAESGLWFLVDGTLAGLTDTGGASIDADCLRTMTHPAAKVILDLRQLLKTRDTFLKGHILGSAYHGRVYTNFNQTQGTRGGTRSGRLSCNAPALQQIPKRNKEVAKVVRALFLPDEGQRWNCRDYSQMDFRVMAHYLENPKITRAYHDNPKMDFHQKVADLMGIPRAPTPGVKGNAKAINLGLSFGMGEGRTAFEMGLPYTTKIERGKQYYIPGEEALDLFRKYHEAVPGVKELLARVSSVAKSRGYIRTILGRRSRFPDKKLAYKAGPMLFQGSAADAMKVKMVEVAKILKGTEGHMLLTVHDEVDQSLPMGAEGDRLNKAIGEAYECFDGENCQIKFNVPIRSESNFGPNWWEASK